MSTINIKEEKVKALFKHNKKVDTIHMCSDHQAFTDETHAASHASSLKNDTVEVFKRNDFSSDSANLDPILEGNLEELDEALKGVSDVEKLNGLKLQETTGKNRTGALKMIDERISDLD